MWSLQSSRENNSCTNNCINVLLSDLFLQQYIYRTKSHLCVDHITFLPYENADEIFFKMSFLSHNRAATTESCWKSTQLTLSSVFLLERQKLKREMVVRGFL